MKEYPILFTGDMVRANRAGKKRMTRRVIKDPLDKTGGQSCIEHAENEPDELIHVHNPKCGGCCDYVCSYPCPYGKPGDRIWVRETWTLDDEGKVIYRADVDKEGYSPSGSFVGGLRFRPSIHMPRKFCRDVYTVTGVRIERLWGITEEDAMAEGCRRGDQYFGENSSRAMSARQSFMWLWQIMYDNNPAVAWITNPWVWVVEYDNPLWEVV